MDFYSPHILLLLNICTLLWFGYFTILLPGFQQCVHTNHTLIFSLFVSQRSTSGFWKSVAKQVPRQPSDMRILNPYFIQEASFKLIGLPHNKGQMGMGVSDLLLLFFSVQFSLKKQQEQRAVSHTAVS